MISKLCNQLSAHCSQQTQHNELYICIIAGSSPQVEIKVDEGPPLNKPQKVKQTESWHDKMSAAEEKEKEVVDGLFDPQPPAGILKKGGYVSGEEEEVAAVAPGKENLEKKRSKKSRRKLVPVWRLVSYPIFQLVP